MATPSRQVRVPDELWAAAERILADRGTTRGAWINAKLAELVAADRVARAFVEGLSPAQADEVAAAEAAQQATR